MIKRNKSNKRNIIDEIFNELRAKQPKSKILIFTNQKVKEISVHIPKEKVDKE